MYTFEVLILFNFITDNQSKLEKYNRILIGILFTIILIIYKIYYEIINLRAKEGGYKLLLLNTILLLSKLSLLSFFSLFKNNIVFNFFKYYNYKFIIENLSIYLLYYLKYLEKYNRITEYIYLIVFQKCIKIIQSFIDIYVINYAIRSDYFNFFILFNSLFCVINIIGVVKSIYKIIKIKYDFDTSETLKFDKKEKNLVDCVICLEPILEGKLLTCQHLYHNNCLSFWILNDDSKKCPICKSEISLKKKVEILSITELKIKLSSIKYNIFEFNKGFSLDTFLNYNKFKSEIEKIIL